ncbi:MAG TPA: 4-hydroxy-tetrahydrodipicolinate synthase [bacterium]|nr:4-hydroxy-tetrahydrodipicolinate synthase [bacterium]
MKGVYTAIVTPFTTSGAIDYPALARLIEFQRKGGVAGLVAGGTTGEAATLSFEEKKELYAFVKKEAAGLDLIAGTGTNNTAESVELTRMARELGYTQVLVVTPYYNKPTCRGLMAHYGAIAATGAQIVLYNVPGRTGLNLPAAWLRELAAIPQITAVKEASGNMAQLADYLEQVGPGRFAMLSGDDFTIAPFVALGGVGVISVLSNIVPAETVQLTAAALMGDVKKAAALQVRYNALNRALFMESNPIPAKTALHLMGYCEEILRAPLATMEPQNRAKLIEVLKGYRLI